jgi:hypothetical protein
MLIISYANERLRREDTKEASALDSDAPVFVSRMPRPLWMDQRALRGSDKMAALGGAKLHVARR